MVLSFNKTLKESLRQIEYLGKSHEFIVHENEGLNKAADFLQRYGQAKWQIVDLLNQRYSTILPQPFGLLNWLHFNEEDELAYFLNEAGSNTLNYSQYKAPFKFHLWLGKNGFIVGIEQKGTGFNAQKIQELKIKENEGAAFDFFRNCRSIIFFDHAQDTKTVYFEQRFEQRFL